VQVLKGDADQLLQRLKAEGTASPADLFITADVARLWKARQEGLLRAVSSKELDKIPAHLRDAEGYWFGLTKRARVFAYDKTAAKEFLPATYADLANTALKGKLLVRSSGNVYNVSLLAGLLGSHGPEATQQIADGIARNLARAPSGGDRDQMKAIVAGQGTVAITNTYYLGQLITSADAAERAVGERMAVIFPDQNGKGTHINVSGAGIAVHSPNPKAAQALLEFLVTPAAQKQFAEGNFEYPVIPGVALHPVVAAWGTFKEDTQSLVTLGKNSAAALSVADKAGWK
jgi:iron(III) transport system substrate-binding protein